VAKLPRARFIPLVYHFFVANLALFWLLLMLDVAPVIVARVFFVWVSVFSLFAVAVFWSFMADLFTAEQGKRLFGFIGAGGTAGGLLGPLITIQLSKPLGSVNLLIAAALLLEIAVFCVYRLERAAAVHADPDGALHAAPQRIGGSAFAAFLEFVRSPYLLGVGLWVSLLSFCATIVYFEQANIISAAIHDRDAQTRIFAGIDLVVNLLSLATQVFITGRLLKRFGTGIAAGALPAVYVVGFAALFLAPTLAVVVTLQIVQRWMNFAIANPARHVIGREEKYKAKNLIDVVVYRGSDALYGWVFDGLQALGLKLGAIALVAWPAAAGWLVLSMVLGRAQEHRAALIDSEAVKPSDVTPGGTDLDANLGDADISVASEGDAMTGERA
jgi:AAA family ATP:ADP antiporter